MHVENRHIRTDAFGALEQPKRKGVVVAVGKQDGIFFDGHQNIVIVFEQAGRKILTLVKPLAKLFGFVGLAVQFIIDNEINVSIRSFGTELVGVFEQPFIFVVISCF